MQSKNSSSIFAAIILAAGLGSRFGGCKAAALVNGVSALERCVASFNGIAAETIIVTGAWKTEVESLILSVRCKYAHNENFSDGMFSSVKTGLRSVSQNVDGIFINPVDVPFFGSGVAKKLAQKFLENNGQKWIVPCFGRKEGHPVLIPAKYKPGILNWKNDGGLRMFLEARESEKISLPINDPGILVDFDTKEDLEKIKKNSLSLT